MCANVIFRASFDRFCGKRAQKGPGHEIWTRGSVFHFCASFVLINFRVLSRMTEKYYPPCFLVLCVCAPPLLLYIYINFEYYERYLSRFALTRPFQFLNHVRLRPLFIRHSFDFVPNVEIFAFLLSHKISNVKIWNVINILHWNSNELCVFGTGFFFGGACKLDVLKFSFGNRICIIYWIR